MSQQEQYLHAVVAEKMPHIFATVPQPNQGNLEDAVRAYVMTMNPSRPRWVTGVWFGLILVSLVGLFLASIKSWELWGLALFVGCIVIVLALVWYGKRKKWELNQERHKVARKNFPVRLDCILSILRDIEIAEWKIENGAGGSKPVALRLLREGATVTVWVSPEIQGLLEKRMQNE